MPSFIRNTSGGTVIGGGALAPRSRRGNTNQADAYWRGGGATKPTSVEYLVIAGGGGGGVGGGGAGGYRNSTGTETSGRNSATETPLTVVEGTTYTVTVGAGGAATVVAGNPTLGSNSVFGSITSLGGGGGAFIDPSLGADGGSGGGGTTAQGFGGGNGGAVANAAGGGGGAGAAGVNASNTAGGAGGNGLSSSITGSAVTRAGGSGGGGSSFDGAGGTGGGQAGDSNIAGTINTGAGGPGAYNNTQQAGGSGIVIVRYLDSFTLATATTGSPSYTNTGGYHIYQWTGSGSITV